MLKLKDFNSKEVRKGNRLKKNEKYREIIKW